MLRVLSAGQWVHSPIISAVVVTSIVTETVRPTVTSTQIITVGLTRTEASSPSSPSSPNAGPSPQPEVTGWPTQPAPDQTNAGQTHTWAPDISNPSHLPVSTTSPTKQTHPTPTKITATLMTSLSDNPARAPSVLPLPLPSVVTFSVSTSTTSFASTMSSRPGTTSIDPELSSRTLITYSRASAAITPMSLPVTFTSLSATPSLSSAAGVTSESTFADSPHTESKPAMPSGAIVACVVGGVVCLGLVILACIFCSRRKGQGLLSSLGMASRRKSDDSLTTLHALRDSEAFPIGAVLPSQHPNRALQTTLNQLPPVDPAKYESTINVRILPPSPPGDEVGLPPRCSVAPRNQVQTCPRTPWTMSDHSDYGSDESKLDYLRPVGFGSEPHVNSWHAASNGAKRDTIKVNLTGFPELDRLAPRRDYEMRIRTRSNPFDLELPLTDLQEIERPNKA
ncbi:Uncharacterized protein PECH_006842 [Penicillium ucsense]|uniref:Uncharacterized protein n=1 Tax=Penicillium ucsense TaxID=2839758 RepID=A0A8J8W7D0_9EURO|nr:Uncharacterized protein PECM_006291 [Penicillium ucsense]KAF7735252.1 Uncharacterized protein PECH_006842 [Penicillium ucsense]